MKSREVPNSGSNKLHSLFRFRNPVEKNTGNFRKFMNDFTISNQKTKFQTLRNNWFESELLSWSKTNFSQNSGVNLFRLTERTLLLRKAQWNTASQQKYMHCAATHQHHRRIPVVENSGNSGPETSAKTIPVTSLIKRQTKSWSPDREI